MANRIDSLLSGVGTLEEVGKAVVDSLDAISSNQLAARNVLDNIGYLLVDAPDLHPCLVLAAAILNAKVGKSGWLVRITPDGDVGLTYLASENERNIIAGLMAG